MLLAGGTWLNLPAYCTASARFVAPGWEGLELALVLNPPGGLAAAWLAMLLAMMPPMLDRPLAAAGERGPGAVGLCLLGYGTVWMAAGAVLILLAIALRALLPAPGAPLAVAALAALAWQASFPKRYCLDRCHALAEGRDSLRFGLSHGCWCVGAGWALMAVPLTVETGHFAAMALVLLVLLVERRRSPRPQPA
jgi:predicted metal-binding membrane protein